MHREGNAAASSQTPASNESHKRTGIRSGDADERRLRQLLTCEQAAPPSRNHILKRCRHVGFPASGLVRFARRLERAQASKVPHGEDSAA